MLPEPVRQGLTWQRARNAFRNPSLLFKNLKFWLHDAVSEEEHIFVVGPPRSGTTLVQNVLQSHSEICGVEGETWFFLRNDYAGFRHSSVPDTEMAQLVREAESVPDLFDRFANAVKERVEGDRFLERTANHALRMDYLTSHFPESTIVFVVRDPRDCLRSAQEHPIIWSTYPDQDRVGGYLEVWKKGVHASLRSESGASVFLLRYEDFCRYPEEKLREMMNHIGFQVQEHQLRPSSYGKGSASESETHSRLKEPITPATIGRWRKVLEEEVVARIERELGEEMQRLNYTITSQK